MSMIGRVYRDPGRRAYRAQPGRSAGFVRVLTRWHGHGPRNVLVLPVERGPRADRLGYTATGAPPYVRPFRGLRRLQT